MKLDEDENEQNQASSEIPKKILSSQEIILLVRNEEIVAKLMNKDLHAEIYCKKLDREAIKLINQEYPNLLQTDEEYIFSVNVISSKMRDSKGYKKIRYYIEPNGTIMKKFET